MIKKNLLIVGDSFSSAQLAEDSGWPVLLCQNFNVTNLSSPGIGEYKILQKIKSIQVNNYDFIIISHTSPNRLHTITNPLYPPGHLYSSSDIIFTDAESKIHQIPMAQEIVNYYKYIFDPEYYNFIHTSCCEKIDQLTQNTKVLHITHFEWSELYQFNNMVNFYSFWLDNQGSIVHYTKEANQVIYKKLLKKIQDMSQ
jgi:hypothetical protein